MHFHVANGLAGYGPDVDESTPTLETLSDALEYAHDELAIYIDIAHQSAHSFADCKQFEEAWQEIERMETLDTLRAHLDPRRQSAPLYVDNPEAYAELQVSQWAEFPHDVTCNSRLYLWDCAETECVEEELICPRCNGTHISPPHGHHLAKCYSCHLAFDTMEEE